MSGSSRDKKVNLCSVVAQYGSPYGIVPQFPKIQDVKDVNNYIIAGMALIQNYILTMKQTQLLLKQELSLGGFSKIVPDSLKNAKYKAFGYCEKRIEEIDASLEHEMDRLSNAYFDWVKDEKINQDVRPMFAGYVYWSLVNLFCHLIVLRYSVKKDETKEDRTGFIKDLLLLVDNTENPSVQIEMNVFLTDRFKNDYIGTYFNDKVSVDVDFISTSASVYTQYVFAKNDTYSSIMEGICQLSKKLVTKVLEGVDIDGLEDFTTLWNIGCNHISSVITNYLSTVMYDSKASLYMYILAFTSPDQRRGVIPVSEYIFKEDYFFNQGRSLVLYGSIGIFKERFPYAGDSLSDNPYNVYTDLWKMKRMMGRDMELPVLFYMSTGGVVTYLTTSKEVKFLRMMDKSKIGDKAYQSLFVLKEIEQPVVPVPQDFREFISLARDCVKTQFAHIYTCMADVIEFEVNEIEKETTYIFGHTIDMIHERDYIESLQTYLYYLPMRSKAVQDLQKMLIYLLGEMKAKDVGWADISKYNQNLEGGWTGLAKYIDKNIIKQARRNVRVEAFTCMTKYFTINGLGNNKLDTLVFFYRDQMENYPLLLKFRPVHHAILDGGYVKFSWTLTDSVIFKNDIYGTQYESVTKQVSYVHKIYPIYVSSKDIDLYKSFYVPAVSYLPILDSKTKSDPFIYSNLLTAIYVNMDGFNALMKSYKVDISQYPHESVIKGIEFHYIWMMLIGRIACYNTYDKADLTREQDVYISVDFIMNALAKSDKYKNLFDSSVESMFRYLKCDSDGKPIKCSIIQTFVFTNELFKKKERSLTNDFWFSDAKSAEIREAFIGYKNVLEGCKKSIDESLSRMRDMGFDQTKETRHDYESLVYLTHMEKKSFEFLRALARKYDTCTTLRSALPPLETFGNAIITNIHRLVKHVKNKRRLLYPGARANTYNVRDAVGRSDSLEERITKRMTEKILVDGDTILFNEDTKAINGERMLGLLIFDLRSTMLLLMAFLLKVEFIINTLINHNGLVFDLNDKDMMFLRELLGSYSALKVHMYKGLNLIRDRRINGDGYGNCDHNTIWKFIEGYIQQPELFDNKDDFGDIYRKLCGWLKEKDSLMDHLSVIRSTYPNVISLYTKVKNGRDSVIQKGGVFVTSDILETINFMNCDDSIKMVLSTGFYDEDLYELYQYITMDDLKPYMDIRDLEFQNDEFDFGDLHNIQEKKNEYMDKLKGARILDISQNVPPSLDVDAAAVRYDTIMSNLIVLSIYFVKSPYLKRIGDLLDTFKVDLNYQIVMKGVPLFTRKFEMITEDSEEMEKWFTMEIVPYLDRTNDSFFNYMEGGISTTQKLFDSFADYVIRLVNIHDERVREFFTILYAQVDRIILPTNAQSKYAFDLLGTDLQASYIFKDILVFRDEAHANLMYGLFFLILFMRNFSKNALANYNYEALEKTSTFIPNCMKNVYKDEINGIFNGTKKLKFDS